MTQAIVPAPSLAGNQLASVGSKEQAEVAVSDMLSNAYGWLTRAVQKTDTPAGDVKSVRAYVYTIAEATKQRDLSNDIKLDAQEMARRADYALGKAIRDGQANGTINTHGEHVFNGNQYGRSGVGLDETNSKTLKSPSEILATSATTRSQIYALADNASPDEFESALDKAKAEGNLSRANLVRKVKPLGEGKPEKVAVVDAETGEIREMARPVSKRLSRIFDTLIISATPSQDVIELVNWESIPKGQASLWHEQLSEAIKELQKINRQLDRRANQ